ncbi:glycosyltransferase family 2 protein [Rhizobium sp. SL86]|uniref:glycosyltransferase family 2 protein n=1 Tax=Rhizobium sp. SL86 TaxID=2995148 RepID=UPI00227299A7|nr:glycosyltransferase [Rhizobium sp. SL86]MCY1669369.1 glycosyltransferase [Rhizobium sp. SL86]
MFLTQNALDPARHIRLSAWLEHAPFAFWLMQQIRPEVVVELGTHNGFSFLSFCQAAKLSNLSSRIYAVDTWQGDEHAGFYGQEIFDSLESELRQEYPGIGLMLRSTFNEARPQFADGSVDILHIDGRHRYEDVLEDFQTWKGVLSDKAVVLFHDTRVQSGDFGVWKLWAEIEKEYPSFEFFHGNGLGVLVPGKNAPMSIKAICNANAEEKALTRSLYARLGSLNSIEYQLSFARENLREVGEQCRLLTEDRNRVVDALEQKRQELVSHQHALEAAGVERDAVIIERDAVHSERETLRDQLSFQTEAGIALEARLKLELEKLEHVEARVSQLQTELGQAYARIGQLDTAITKFQSSSSWRLTKPYRWLGHQLKRAKHLLRVVPGMVRRNGGLLRFMSKVIRLLMREGPKGLLSAWRYNNAVPAALVDHRDDERDYSSWLNKYASLDKVAKQRIETEISSWESQPLISIIMPVYNPPLDLLEDAVNSVRSQMYPRWELCIADDCSTDKRVRKYLNTLSGLDSRIKVEFRPKNGHISEASNSAINIATGEWIALFDQDDLLTSDALFYVAREIVRNKDVKLIYSDEDKFDGSKRYDPYFKPDWNPDLLRSHNLVCHLGVYKLDRIQEIGGFRKGLEGAQDHDLVLRFSEGLQTNEIVHIPRVLYHWRSHSGSTAQSTDNKSYAVTAGQKAIQDHLDRIGLPGQVDILPTNMYRVKYDLPEALPLVSIVIPTRNGVELLRQCINSVVDKTIYKNYEIIIIDNNSDDVNALNYFEEIGKTENIKIIRDESPFNYSALNNKAVAQANGEFIVLMNNDIEVISPDWLSEMMGLAIQKNVGAVGARLWYPDDRLQHGGVILGIGGVAGHSHKFLPKGAHGYFSRGELTQTLSAVTAACLLIRKSVYEEVGGLDEENLKVAFNDVDFCIRVRGAGYRNVWTPYAELYHHESATRGHEDTPEKKERFRSEVLYMLDRWKDVLSSDPAYNPNLTLEYEDFSLAWPPRNDGDPTLAS